MTMSCVIEYESTPAGEIVGSKEGIRVEEPEGLADTTRHPPREVRGKWAKTSEGSMCGGEVGKHLIWTGDGRWGDLEVGDDDAMRCGVRGDGPRTTERKHDDGDGTR